MANENGKDVANSLSGYSNALNKGTNAVLDSANQINKWYAEQVNKIAGEENQDTRLETNVDNTIEEDIQTLEETIEQLENDMDAAATDFVRLRELSEKKEQSEALLEQKMERWVYLSDLAERIEAQKNS